MLSASDKSLLQQALVRFDGWSPTVLASHTDDNCCTAARIWFQAMDSEYRTASNPAGVPPLWMQQYFHWGAAPLQVTWCEAMQRQTLECGTLAALAHTALIARRTRVVRVQVVMRYPPSMITRWHNCWYAEGCSTSWLLPPYVYHEVVGIVQAGELHLWDPSEFIWMDSGLSTDAGIVALRIVSDEDAPVFRWGTEICTANQWHSVLDMASDG